MFSFLAGPKAVLSVPGYWDAHAEWSRKRSLCRDRHLLGSRCSQSGGQGRRHNDYQQVSVGPNMASHCEQIMKKTWKFQTVYAGLTNLCQLTLREAWQMNINNLRCERHDLLNILKLQSAFLYSIYHQRAGITSLFHTLILAVLLKYTCALN